VGDACESSVGFAFGQCWRVDGKPGVATYAPQRTKSASMNLLADSCSCAFSERRLVSGKWRRAWVGVLIVQCPEPDCATGPIAGLHLDATASIGRRRGGP